MTCRLDSWLGWKFRNHTICLSNSSAQTCLAKAWSFLRGGGILRCMGSLIMQCSGALDPAWVNQSKKHLFHLCYMPDAVFSPGETGVNSRGAYRPFR